MKDGLEESELDLVFFLPGRHGSIPPTRPPLSHQAPVSFHLCYSVPPPPPPDTLNATAVRFN